jgi:hypothetical protein
MTTQQLENPYRLDREKYLQIAQTEGLPAAITRLHLDMEQMEHETFEGREGWQPQLFEYLKEVREFSRELWGMRETVIETFRHPTAPRGR